MNLPLQEAGAAFRYPFPRIILLGVVVRTLRDAALKQARL
jgi:hypothetical protein